MSASTYSAVHSVNLALDPVDKQSLIGAHGVSGYARNRENHCQKCHKNRSVDLNGYNRSLYSNVDYDKVEAYIKGKVTMMHMQLELQHDEQDASAHTCNMPITACLHISERKRW